MAKRRRKSKRILKSLLFALLVATAGVVCYFVWDAYFREDDAAVVPGGAGEQVEVQESVVDEVVEAEADGDVVSEKEEIEQYDGVDPNTATGLTGVVTYASKNDGVLRIRVNIDQFLNGGICNLELRSKGSVVYTESVNIIDSASTATCEGFDIDASGIPSGNLEIIVDLESGEKRGEIRGEVDL